jgi:hypothetical protein
MKTARGAWNTVSRANPGLFPPKNPFEKIGLRSTSRETPNATFAELMAFRAKVFERMFPYSSLAQVTLKSVIRHLLQDGDFVHRIGAIQIQRNEEVQFVAGDNFHRECVSVGQAISDDFLHDLVTRGIIGSYP